jgi:hypothetical protein
VDAADLCEKERYDRVLFNNEWLVSPLLLRTCDISVGMNSMQIRGGKVNFSYPPAKQFEEEKGSKTPYGIANKLHLKYRKKWVQPKGLTKEKYREQQKAKPPKPHIISDRQKELIQIIVDAGKAKNPLDAFDAYKRLSISPPNKAYLGILQAVC